MKHLLLGLLLAASGASLQVQGPKDGRRLSEAALRPAASLQAQGPKDSRRLSEAAAEGHETSDAAATAAEGEVPETAHSAASYGAPDHGGGKHDAFSDAEDWSGGHDEHGTHPYYAILFPVVTLLFGVVIYYLLSRYLHFLPYTAVMFLVGIVYGLIEANLESAGNNDGQLVKSIDMWSHIDSHTLLMVFLPGLLFKDAFSLNVYLFAKAFWQAWTMAFPEVLAGTALSGLVGYYVFPYGWSWFFCLAFGAILAATDPVAVAALLNECGAPPRLKTHIAGEALLNDGSAMVFFVIFEEIWLYDASGGLVGVSHDAATGFALFFKMSLGALGIGVGFGLALVVILWLLNRRFSFEENVVQVMATLAIAYITYYAAEVPGCSGVIAVVFCGLTAKAFGNDMINDQGTMHKFWDLVEHILNTVIFALGGLEWGEIISNKVRPYTFTGSDWGYLFALYALCTVIRGLLVASFYPIVSRIGLKSNVKESLFIVWGGLRGAVGIALALAFDNAAHRSDFTTQVFFHVGGMAFLTLFVNGVTAGPLLKKLGLANISEKRKKITSRYNDTITMTTLTNLLHYFGMEEFAAVDFAVIRSHIPRLQELSDDQVRAAIKMNKQHQPAYEYKKPALWSLEAFVSPELAGQLDGLASISATDRLKSLVTKTTVLDGADSSEVVNEGDLIETRMTFVEMLISAFNNAIASGDIDARSKSVVFALRWALETETVNVSNGMAIKDFGTLKEKMKKVEKLTLENDEEAQTPPSRRRFSVGRAANSEKSRGREYKRNTRQIAVALALISNHVRAQKAFKDEFQGKLGEAGRIVLEESEAQIKLAREHIASINPADSQASLAHILCVMLLNRESTLVGSYVDRGLLRETEAEHEVEHIAHFLHEVYKCDHEQCKADGSKKSEDAAGEKEQDIAKNESEETGSTPPKE